MLPAVADSMRLMMMLEASGLVQAEACLGHHTARNHSYQCPVVGDTQAALEVPPALAVVAHGASLVACLVVDPGAFPVVLPVQVACPVWAALRAFHVVGPEAFLAGQGASPGSLGLVAFQVERWKGSERVSAVHLAGAVGLVAGDHQGSLNKIVRHL